MIRHRIDDMDILLFIMLIEFSVLCCPLTGGLKGGQPMADKGWRKGLDLHQNPQ